MSAVQGVQGGVQGSCTVFPFENQRVIVSVQGVQGYAPINHARAHARARVCAPNTHNTLHTLHNRKIVKENNREMCAGTLHTTLHTLHTFDSGFVG